jgi:lysylphosphatidylglycerol synthetase-like protein (DUF2156 family)
MKKITISQWVNIVTLVAMLALVLSPVLVGAQLTIPDSGGTGLPNDSSLRGFIIRVINIALALAGLIAVFFLILGGFRYITSLGNEEAAGQAKKIILNAIIGIVIIILSFVIVRVISNAVARGDL